MPSWALLVTAFAVLAGLYWMVRYNDAMQHRLENANQLGWAQGYFEGWLARAKNTPLHILPPTLFEIEEALRQRHGWRGWPKDSLYDYLRIDELSYGSVPGCASLKEWRERKLKEINDKYGKPGK
jgi:hypothetical protein